MRLPTDRGIAVIRSTGDGTNSVAICSEVVDGAPRNTYALHSGVEVAVDPEVTMIATSTGRHSTGIVEVFRDDADVVQIRRPRAF